MNKRHPILVAALLLAMSTPAQAVLVSVADSSGRTNLTGEGTTFTHTLLPAGAPEGEFDRLLLTLDFDVSSNAAAQLDTISLFLGGTLQASGPAATFGVTDLDVTDFFDFATGTLTYQLFRAAPQGGGNIKLRHSSLALLSTGKFAAEGVATQSPQDAALAVPEPAALGLLGLGLLGLAKVRRRVRPSIG